jgi:hypothetical protein
MYFYFYFYLKKIKKHNKNIMKTKKISRPKGVIKHYKNSEAKFRLNLT